MLPFGAREAAQEVNRTRLRIEGIPLEARAQSPPHTEDAWCAQGNANDVAEDRAVLVPTDGGAWHVFGDKDLVKRTGCDFGEVFRPRAYDRKEVRDILGPG
jgi:hypothetical protein